MASLTTNRSPQELSAALWALTGVDWPTIWAGVPKDAQKRSDWCAGFGWQPLWFQAGQHVRTASGLRLFLASAAPGRPVTRVECVPWGVRAAAAKENPQLIRMAVERWEAQLAGAQEVLGVPDWQGGWHATEFPRRPVPDHLQDSDRRLEYRSPHRLALWTFSTPGAPAIELRADLGVATAADQWPGDARIVLACHGPADPEPTGPGWRL
ncbi:hypothetical protein ABZS86_02595 [Streptomyces sp. NPDC005355]|uniref:hypothetical protein n=1 Tax=Streptomyces sp. NPDC005355 TaxID=3157038 RepID=UPI00339EAFB0